MSAIGGWIGWTKGATQSSSNDNERRELMSAVPKRLFNDPTLVYAHITIREYLYRRPPSKWTTQREITKATGLSGPLMRRVCQAYPSTFISSTEGYKLVYRASSAEIRHCLRTLLSRAAKITHRASVLAGQL